MENGDATRKMVEILSRILTTQEEMAAGLAQLGERVDLQTARMEKGFADLGRRLDIIANWRGGEVVSMKERIDDHEARIARLEKPKTPDR